jgi:hypothetical protein
MRYITYAQDAEIGAKTMGSLQGRYVGDGELTA